MMKRFVWSAAACLLLSGATVVLAKDIEVSSLDKKRVAELGAGFNKTSTERAKAHYIVDVAGKNVRLVGQRFYPDSTKEIELIGRSDALQREAVRLEASLPPGDQK